MSKSVINDYQRQGMHIVGSNNTLIVAASGVVHGLDEQAPVYTDIGTENNSIFINGTLEPADDLGTAIEMMSSKSEITIGASGLLAGQIFVAGADVDIVNAGHILGGTGSGADFENGATGGSLDNSGVIVGQYDAVDCVAAVTIKNESAGSLIGYQYGIELYTGGQKIINHGLIQGQQIGIWSKYGGNAHIVNDGAIKGGIDLSDGNDTIDTRGGTIIGDIVMGSGLNLLVTDNAKYQIADADGSNRVESTVSYTLNDNTGTLTLIGKKNINATGSDNIDVDNFLYGNSGNNIMKGLDGYNELYGRGGTDTLIGGVGVDLFGIGKGYGHDTVKGFTDSTDGIDVISLGPDNFNQLKSHIEQHGADTWLDFGKDVLILKNTDHNVLDQSNFLFNY
jgi:hypothetical protein